jgi:hypothetical protein
MPRKGSGPLSEAHRQKIAESLRGMEKRNGHGHAADPLYRAIIQAIIRCTNPENPAYPHYGGRGIRVCERYRNSETRVEAWYSDLGERPSPDLSIDRIDNDGNYSCGQCDECRREGWPFNLRWADRLTQARNRRPARRG